MNEAPYFHVAILVPDLAQAMERFGRALGMTFAPPIRARIPGIEGQPGATADVAPVTYSRDGPPYLELIEAAGDGVFGAGRGYGVHHIGIWVDDPRAAARSLLGAGLRVEAGLDDGTDRVALTDPADLFGVRIELCGLAIREGWGEWVGGRSDAL
jgi:catechol 2,3-dioxygenase-like lactoylglutathione lyase family enzyme